MWSMLVQPFVWKKVPPISQKVVATARSWISAHFSNLFAGVVFQTAAGFADPLIACRLHMSSRHLLQSELHIEIAAHNGDGAPRCLAQDAVHPLQDSLDCLVVLVL